MDFNNSESKIKPSVEGLFRFSHVPVGTMSGFDNRGSWRDAARPKEKKELFQIQEFPYITAHIPWVRRMPSGSHSLDHSGHYGPA